MSKTPGFFTLLALGAAAGTVGYIAGRKVARGVMENYREFQASQRFDIDYQARHAEELGAPIPFNASRHRPHVDGQLTSHPPYGR